MPGTCTHFLKYRGQRVQLGVILLTLFGGFLHAASRTWTASDGDWANNGSGLLWSGGDEPDSDDIAIITGDVAVRMTTDNLIAGLTLSNGARLSAFGNDLTVEGPTVIKDSTFNVGTSLFTGQNLTLTNGQLALAGGGILLRIDKTPDAFLNISSGSGVQGNGGVGFMDEPASPTTLITNNGSITANNNEMTLTGPPLFQPSRPVGATLRFSAFSRNARIDLDGSNNTGTLNVNTNQALDIDLPLADSFDGTINLGVDCTLDIASPWTLSGGTVTISNAPSGTIGSFVPGGTAYLRGGTLTQSGGVINVTPSSRLYFLAPFKMTGGSLIPAGDILFDADAEIDRTAGAITLSSSASISVQPGRNVEIHTSVSNAGTIDNNGGTLVLSSGGNDYDGPDDRGNLYTFSGGVTTISGISAAPLTLNGNIRVTSGSKLLCFNSSPLNFSADSTLTLENGILGGTRFQFSGPVSVFGTESRIESGSVTFDATARIGLHGNLSLDQGAIIREGAIINSSGRLIVPKGKSLTISGATPNFPVNVRMEGILTTDAPAGSTLTVRNLDLAPTGQAVISIGGHPFSNLVDKIVVTGTANLDGAINVVLADGFQPALNQIYTVLTANEITGSVDLIQLRQNSGLLFNLIRTGNTIQLKVTVPTPFQDWIRTSGLESFFETPERVSPGADPDGDGFINLAEFAFDQSPRLKAPVKVSSRIATIGGVPALIHTLPVRDDSTPDPADPPGGEIVILNHPSRFSYKIQASDDLATFDQDIIEITGPDAAAIHSGMPTLNPGWTYRTFRTRGSVSDHPRKFLRVDISERFSN